MTAELRLSPSRPTLELQVVAFARSFSHRDWRRLKPFLDEHARFRLTGFPDISGRHDILQLWRRKFRTYLTLSLDTERLVSQENLVIARQTLGLQRHGGPPTTVEGMSIYELRDGRILAWDCHLDPSASQADVALWRRLRRARW